MVADVARGYLLDHSSQILKIHCCANLKVETSVNLDKAAPGLDVAATISTQLSSDCTNCATTDNSDEFHDMMDDTSLEKSINVKLIDSIMAYGVPTADKAAEYDKTFVSFVKALPKDTKFAIQFMRSPVIIRFPESTTRIFSRRLCSNTPSWAEKYVSSSSILKDECRNIHMLLDADTGFIVRLKALQALKTPVKIQPKVHQRLQVHEDTEISEPDHECSDSEPDVEQFRNFKARNEFENMLEYTKIQYNALILDQKEEVDEIRSFEAKTRKLILLSRETIREASSTTHYFGLIEKPAGKAFYLQPGTTFEISFDDRRGSSKWPAVVTDDRVLRKDKMVPVFVTRGKIVGSNANDATAPSSVVYAQNMDLRSIDKQVRQASCMQVHIRVVDCDSGYTNVRHAIQCINTQASYRGEKNVRDDFGARMRYVLLGQRLELLPVMDLYGPAKLQVDPRSLMDSLNIDQTRAVVRSRELVGGLQIVQGPPGTGKTYLTQQLSAPLLASKEDIVILVGAPTNRGADDLARLLRSTWHRLIIKHNLVHMRARPVLRLINQKTEIEILRCYKPCSPSKVKDTMESSSDHTQKPVASREPSTRPEPKVAQVGGMPKQDLDVYLLEHQAAMGTQSTGIQDERVQDVEISVGYMMLMLSGIIPNSDHGDSKSVKYERFRALHLKHQKKEELSPEDQSYWNKTCAMLFTEALTKASAIVGTTAGITASFTLPFIQSRVAAVFLDENAFQTEIAMMPLFAAKFTLNPCLVVIGDQQQIAPVTKAQAKENPLVSQLQLPFMTRMINIGHQYTLLREQYRMVPQIAEICNALTYGSRLITAQSAQVGNRPIARQFRKFSRKYVQRDTNYFMFDVPPGIDNQTKRPEGRSKCNDFFIGVLAGLVEQLLAEFKDTATIAVLTAYNNQLRHYEIVRGMMKEYKLPHHDQLTVNSFVGAQGREYDITVVEVIVDKNVGFLSDKNQMNVAMSRAKNGLIFVCDKIALQNAIRKTRHPGGGKYAQYLDSLLELFGDKTYVWPQQDTLPVTRYYKP